MTLEQPRRALRLLERWPPGDATGLVLLGNARLDGDPVAVDADHRLGVVMRPIGDASRARLAFEGALALDPGSRAAQRGLTRSLIALDELDEAERVARTTRCGDDLLAEIAERRASAGPAPMTRSQLADVVPLLAAHVANHPGDTIARGRLTRHHLALLNFEAAAQLTALVPSTDVLGHLAIWAEHTARGRHDLAYRSKLGAARVLAQLPARRTGPVSDLLLRLQAMNFAEGPLPALSSVRRRWVFAPTSTERLLRIRAEADLALLEGDPALLHRAASDAPTPGGAARRRFADAVSGRRILVVGPSPLNRPAADDLDAYDTIVTTRQPFEADAGERRSIIYLTNESARYDAATYRSLFESDQTILSVRPSMVRRLPSPLASADVVRVQPFEDTSTLFGTHFAIPRILHDLIANRAASITICGVDFFLSEQTHVDGYDPGIDDRFASVPFNIAHDFAYDFWYVQRLRTLGLLHTPPPIDDLLRTPVHRYVEQLGAVFR